MSEPVVTKDRSQVQQNSQVEGTPEMPGRMPPATLIAGGNAGEQRVAQAQGGGEEAGPSEEFMAHLRLREGYRTDVYLDSRGLPTAGVGHLMLASELATYPVGSIVPESVLQRWLAQDSARAWRAAQDQVRQLPAAANTPAFTAALGSVNFQLGTGWNTEHRRTWAFMRAGQWNEAATEAADSAWATQTPVRVADFQRALRSLAAGGNGSAAAAPQSIQGNGNVRAIASGTVLGDDVNVRSGPATTYNSVRQFDTGATVTIYETQNGWVRIAPGQWIKAEFVRQTPSSTPVTNPSTPTNNTNTPRPPAPPTSSTTPIGTGSITGNDVNVRSGPGTNFSTVGDQLDRGMSVSIYERRDGWVRIGAGKWVSSQFVAAAGQTQTPTTGGTPAPASPGTVRETGSVTGTNVNVRSGPGQSFATVGAQLNTGASVPIYEIKDGWLRIGINRWVFGQFVNYSGNRPATPRPVTPSQPATPTQPATPVQQTPAPATGTASGTSRAAVTITNSVGSDGHNSSGDVRKIQQLLKDLGFRISVTGEVGKNTIGAISAFQIANGMTDDGRVDAGGTTLRLMNTTPGNAFYQTAATFEDDPNAPRLTSSRWNNRGKLTTDGSGESIPKPQYENMRKLIRQMEVIGANITGGLTVGSGYRSPYHNANTEGSAARSNHQFGRAVDIYSDFAPSELRAKLRQLIREGKIHAGGIGLYSWGCHYDIDERREW